MAQDFWKDPRQPAAVYGFHKPPQVGGGTRPKRSSTKKSSSREKNLVPGLDSRQTPGRMGGGDDSFLGKIADFFKAAAPTGAAATGAIAGGVPRSSSRGYQPPMANEPRGMGAITPSPFRPMTSGFRLAGNQEVPWSIRAPEGNGDRSSTSDLPPNFLEYLQQFASQNSADLSAFDQQESSARSRAAEGKNAILGLYGSLASQLASNGQGIDQDYAAAQERTRQLAEETTSAIQAGSSAANAQRKALMQALGMQDQAGNNASREAEADVVDARADAALERQGTGNLLNVGQSSAQDINRGNQVAARQRGTEEAAGLERQLSEMLAQIASQRSQAASQAQGQNFDLAKTVFDADSRNYWNQREFSAGRDDEMWNRALEDRRLEASIKPPAVPQDKAVTSQILGRMQADRVPKPDQNAIMEMLMSGEAVDLDGRAKITPQLIASYGLDPNKYTPAYIGAHAMEFYRGYQK